MSDLSRYIGLFLEEAADHLQTLERFAARAAGATGDAARGEVKEAFRAAHSIKGAAATVGLDPLAELAHALEDLLDLLRDTPADQEVLALIVEATDQLQAATDRLRGGHETDVAALARTTGRLRAHHAARTGAAPGHAASDPETAASGPRAGPAGAGERGTAADEGSAAAPRDPVPEAIRHAIGRPSGGAGETAVYGLAFRLRRGCIAPRARLMVARRAIENHGQMVEIVPAEELWKDLRTQERSQEVFVAVQVPARAAFEDLVARVALVPDLEDVKEVAATSSAATSDTGTAGSTIIPRDAVSGADAPAHNAPTQSTVRVHVEHLDRLLDMVGELKIAQNALDRLLRRAPVERQDPYVMDDALRSIDLGLREVYDEVLEIRTLPASLVTDRLPRIARQAARQVGKEVTLHVEGEATQLDRSVIEALADPLMHLVRNAVDHGIETPAERTRVGKPAEGRIWVRIQKVSSGVRVEVQDDGAGIDLERVRAKAVQTGMYRSTETDTIRREDWARVLDLLTHSGFSTAEHVGDISGRGVGLDVVRSSVEGIGGNMALAMPDSGGTVFRLSLPANLSVTDAFACEIDGQTYYVPAGAVVAGLALTPEQVCEGVVRPEAEQPEDLQQGTPEAEAAGGKHPGSGANDGAHSGSGDAAGTGTAARASPEAGRVGRALIRHAAAREVVDREIPIITLTGDAHERIMRYGTEGREHVLGVVIQRHGRRACLLVDRLGTMEEIVVKRFLHPSLPLPLVAGATVRPDGRVAVILDTSELFRRRRAMTKARPRDAA